MRDKAVNVKMVFDYVEEGKTLNLAARMLISFIRKALTSTVFLIYPFLVFFY